MPRLVEFSIDFLHRSWNWLNDPEIKSLTMTPDFTKEEQLAFFEKLPGMNDYWIRGVVEDNIPVGAVGLKHINTESAEYWGYIGEKQFWGKGIGNFIIQQAITKAKELGLKELYLFVDEHNHKAKQLYLRTNFRIDSPGKMEKYRLSL